MKLINENFKKAGYFNTALIIIAIVLRLISFVNSRAITKIDCIVCIGALVYGLIYALNGYKKDAAKYYKTFMYLYLLSNTISFIIALTSAISEIGNLGVLMIVVNGIILLSVCSLTFIEDIGESKSNIFALSILLLNILKLVIDIAIIGTTITTPHTSAWFANIVLACVLCVFVSAKYADKASRGSK